ncbi:hypothetical protein DDZ14_16120 [Maritimibacter sp. 55A14]|uniref:phage tail terminator protein n=1 Tax=Maritimibacter sp. 55A14 TaxID=2174844 RepID=UPI000D62212A|nr:hypothetical protein [Maritimibacter sp. 55A14]PWE29967.1 hypothetical protein DDZ14_16120 [Maritimibacter sp. 55A14]
MIEDVIARLEDKVPDLAGRIEGAAELADLMRRGALPQVTPAAHVLPLGLRGGNVDTGSGLYRQETQEAIGVVITWRSYNAAAGVALADIRTLVGGVIGAIAGWAPAGAIGDFRLMRGQLVSMSAGTIVYQIDFSLTDQLRIAT